MHTSRSPFIRGLSRISSLWWKARFSSFGLFVSACRQHFRSLPGSSPKYWSGHTNRGGRGSRLLRYLDYWLVVVESLLLLLRHSDLLQLCQDLGIVINWEMSDLQPSSRVQYQGMIITTSTQEMVFVSDAHVSWFQDLEGSFFFPSISSGKDVAAAVRPHGFFGTVRSQWHLKDHCSPMSDDPSLLVSLLPECAEEVHWWPQEGRWLAGISMQGPPPSLPLQTDASLSGWGARFLNLTAYGVWPQEESLLRINVLEMWVVVLVLAAFLPQLAGQTVVLMSDSATVVAYLRNQECTVSRMMYNMAREVIRWAELHFVTLSVWYIPGKKNVLAD